MDEIFERLKRIIAVELQVDPTVVRPNSSLREELGMDSIATLNIFFAAQTEFGIDDIGEDEIFSLQTVADAESLIRRHVDTVCRS